MAWQTPISILDSVCEVDLLAVSKCNFHRLLRSVTFFQISLSQLQCTSFVNAYYCSNSNINDCKHITSVSFRTGQKSLHLERMLQLIGSAETLRVYARNKTSCARVKCS
jgi:hypothetical protein